MTSLLEGQRQRIKGVHPGAQAIDPSIQRCGAPSRVSEGSRADGRAGSLNLFQLLPSVQGAGVLLQLQGERQLHRAHVPGLHQQRWQRCRWCWRQCRCLRLRHPSHPHLLRSGLPGFPGKQSKRGPFLAFFFVFGHSRAPFVPFLIQPPSCLLRSHTPSSPRKAGIPSLVAPPQ